MRAAMVDETRAAEDQGRDAARACGQGWEHLRRPAEQQAAVESESRVARLRRESMNLEADERACLAGFDATPTTSPSALKYNRIEGVGWFAAASSLVLAG